MPVHPDPLTLWGEQAAFPPSHAIFIRPPASLQDELCQLAVLHAAVRSKCLARRWKVAAGVTRGTHDDGSKARASEHAVPCYEGEMGWDVPEDLTHPDPLETAAHTAWTPDGRLCAHIKIDHSPPGHQGYLRSTLRMTLCALALLQAHAFA